MRTYQDYERILSLWEQGYPKKTIATLTGIPRATVRDCIYRYESLSGLQESEVQAKLEWQPQFDNPEFCRNYAYLLGLYLGDGTISKARKTYKLRIFQDMRYTNLIARCIRTINAILPDNKANQLNSSSGASVEIYCYSNKWPEIFPQDGDGRKHDRPIKLEVWQQEIVDSQTGQLLAGLIHSDGCRIEPVVNGTVYSRYQFTNMSKDIQRIFCDACDSLGIRWTVYGRNITIARRKDVAYMDTFIEPKS